MVARLPLVLNFEGVSFKLRLAIAVYGITAVIPGGISLQINFSNGS